MTKILKDFAIKEKKKAFKQNYKITANYEHIDYVDNRISQQ